MYNYRLGVDDGMKTKRIKMAYVTAFIVIVVIVFVTISIFILKSMRDSHATAVENYIYGSVDFKCDNVSMMLEKDVSAVEDFASFISDYKTLTETQVKIKLNAVASVVKGKRVILIDDSIVRGTTSGRIVKLLRDAGATEVHMRVSAPPFLNPCYYGTDIDSREHLIACHHTVEEISKIIGADSLGYLSIECAKKLAQHETGEPCDYCTACFGGEYPTDVPTEMYKNKFDQKISENKPNADK